MKKKMYGKNIHGNSNAKQENSVEQYPYIQQNDPNMELGYRIIKELGIGVSANVYQVQKGNEIFALKRYKINEVSQYTTKDEILEKYFDREIDIVQKINHMNILKYYLANKDKHLIIIEYMEGILI